MYEQLCCSALQCLAVCRSEKTLEYARLHVRIADRYGVATMSRRLKTIGLFCRISSLL